MNKQVLLNKLKAYHSVEFKSECNCDFEWFISPNGTLEVNTTHDLCREWYELKVRGLVIFEKSSNGKEQYYHGFTPDDVPDCIKESMNIFQEGVVASKLDVAHFSEKRDSLAAWLHHAGLFPERYGNFFLLVEYHQPIPISWEEAAEWATQYLESADPYFIYVDNMVFAHVKCKNDHPGLTEEQRKENLFEGALVRATFLDINYAGLDYEARDIVDHIETILDEMGMDSRFTETRCNLMKAFKAMEQSILNAYNTINTMPIL